MQKTLLFERFLNAWETVCKTFVFSYFLHGFKIMKKQCFLNVFACLGNGMLNACFHCFSHDLKIMQKICFLSVFSLFGKRYVTHVCFCIKIIEKKTLFHAYSCSFHEFCKKIITFAMCIIYCACKTHGFNHEKSWKIMKHHDKSWKKTWKHFCHVFFCFRNIEIHDFKTTPHVFNATKCTWCMSNALENANGKENIT